MINTFTQVTKYAKAVLWVDTYNLLPKRAINSEEEARNRGEYIANSIYGNFVNLSDYIIKVEDEGTEWNVWYAPPTPPPQVMPDGFIMKTMILGGGGPEIHLSKSSGKITYYALQK